MSFICCFCKKAQPDRTKPIKVVLETRRKVYPVRRDKEDEVIDKGGIGRETVKEAYICKYCARKRE
jgi:hypothetical protein